MDICVALKRTKTGNIEDLQEETKKLLTLKHKNVTEAFGMCNLADNSRCLVMELMEGGALLSHLIGLRFQTLSQQKGCVPHLLRFLLQIAEGMAFLENKGFIHRDIAARNIFLTSLTVGEANAKLGDFGLVKNLYASGYYSLRPSSSIPVAWSAPEVLEGLKSHSAFMLSSPNETDGAYASELTLVASKNDWHYSIKSDVWNDFMLQTWAWNKEERPSFVKIVKKFEALQGHCAPDKKETSEPQQSISGTESTAKSSHIPFRLAYVTKEELSLAPFSKSRFRGCLLGALLGCCFSRYVNNHLRTSLRGQYESDNAKKLTETLVGFLSSGYKLPYDAHFHYVKNVLDSVIREKTVQHDAIAKSLISTFGRKEGYSLTIMNVVEDWKQNDANLFGPALKECGGLGSYGPMGCLRAIPIAMFLGHDAANAMKECITQCRLTHAHPVALVNTALLASGIMSALAAKGFEELKNAVMADTLKVSHELCSSEDNKWFASMTARFNDSLEKKADIELANMNLGSDSLKSQVFIGVFAFLKACQTQGETLENPLMRSLVYASTKNEHFEIATVVTGALAGAYFGHRWISPALLNRMEDAKEIHEAAEALHGLLMTGGHQ